MIIGVDIDGVLTNLEEWQFRTGSEFTSKPIQNYEAFDLKGIFGLSNEEYVEFLDRYLTDYSVNEPAREGAASTILDLAKYMNVICFDAKYNRTCAGDRIFRVSSWQDIDNCIQKMVEK